MNLLTKLEKNKLLWWLVTLCTFFFFLRLPSIIEPYWYGDEGIYEVIGQAMDHGRLLYQDIWDNKPPLLYVVYALSLGDQSTVKILSIIAGILSIVVFFLLSQKLFNKPKITFFITTLFVLLLGTPVLEGNIANAEDFILPLILLAGLLIYHSAISKASLHKINKEKYSSIFNPKSLIFLAGLLLGIAFLFKIVAIFDFAAFFAFFILIMLPNNISWELFTNTIVRELRSKHQESWFHSLLLDSCFLLLGFLLPLFITILYFVFNHALQDFFQAVFFGNINYVGWQNSFLGIPQGLLILKCLLLLLALCLIFWKRQKLAHPTLFILIWLVFSLFNVFFSQRPYTHYVIVLMPSFCLFLGLLLKDQPTKNRLKCFVGIAVISILLCLEFQFNAIKSYLYYPNAISFLTGQESVEIYQSFFDPKVPRDYALAAFITNNTKASDSIFVWGNNPQIYALSHKIPPGKYTVAYHITQNNAFEETQQAIETVKPKYVIVLKETEPLPFALPLYIMQYNLPGATIYERSL